MLSLMHGNVLRIGVFTFNSFLVEQVFSLASHKNVFHVFLFEWFINTEVTKSLPLIET